MVLLIGAIRMFSVIRESHPEGDTRADVYDSLVVILVEVVPSA